jgi:hypothetical protein
MMAQRGIPFAERKNPAKLCIICGEPETLDVRASLAVDYQ